MKKKWVALCSTAIGAIYAAGYFATETQATIQQPQQLAQANVQADSSQSQQQAQVNTPTGSSQPEQQAQVNTPTTSSQPQQLAQVSTPTASSQPQQKAPVSTPTASSQPQQKAPVSTPTASSQPQQKAPVSTPTASSQPKSLYKDGIYKGTGSNRRGSIQVAVTIKSDKITDVEISHFAMHYSERDVVGLPSEVLQKQSAQVQNVSGATYSTQAFEDAVQEALSQARNT
jgi:uncharacterized protein with FMN-binding domain